MEPKGGDIQRLRRTEIGSSTWPGLSLLSSASLRASLHFSVSLPLSSISLPYNEMLRKYSKVPACLYPFTPLKYLRIPYHTHIILGAGDTGGREKGR